MSETLSPRCVKRGISFSISVVLPLPDQPANPNTFICGRFYRPQQSLPGRAASRQAVPRQDRLAAGGQDELREVVRLLARSIHQNHAVVGALITREALDRAAQALHL